VGTVFIATSLIRDLPSCFFSKPGKKTVCSAQARFPYGKNLQNEWCAVGGPPRQPIK